MIERQIVSKHMKEYLMQEFIKLYLPTGSYSKIDLRKTPLGEKIIIHTSRPGLVVGRKGANLSELTSVLKSKYGMEGNLRCRCNRSRGCYFRKRCSKQQGKIMEISCRPHEEVRRYLRKFC